MTTFTDVFERKETKYRLDAAQHRAMVAALCGCMAPDMFGWTRILSSYWDTPERSLIERSLDKPLYKEKLRLRGYGEPNMDGRVFVEIKKKYKGIVYKRRVGCSLAAARAYLKGVPFERACMRYPLPDPAMAAESLSPRSVQIAREIDAFVARHGPLRPSMLIMCERVAYVARAECAETPADLRITFDVDVAYRDLFASAAPAKPLLPRGHAIMEVKSAGPLPLWLVRSLDACQAYPSSFSKYGAAYRACAAPGPSAPLAVSACAAKKGVRCA